MPRKKKPTPPIQHSRAEIPALEPESDGEIDIPISRVDRNDPELRAAFGKLASRVYPNNPKLADKTGRLAIAYYDVMRLRFDARIALICANAAVQLAADDRVIVTNQSDAEFDHALTRIWDLPPLTASVRQFLVEQLRKLSTIIPWDSGGRPRGSADRPNANRRKRREANEDAINTGKKWLAEEDVKEVLGVDEIPRHVDLDANVRERFDPKTGRKKLTTDLYDTLGGGDPKKRNAVKTRHHRQRRRQRAAQKP